MSDKPRISKHLGYWVVDLPLIGFSPERWRMPGFLSQQAALRWLETYRKFRCRPS